MKFATKLSLKHAPISLALTALLMAGNQSVLAEGDAGAAPATPSPEVTPPAVATPESDGPFTGGIRGPWSQGSRWRNNGPWNGPMPWDNRWGGNNWGGGPWNNMPWNNGGGWGGGPWNNMPWNNGGGWGGNNWGPWNNMPWNNGGGWNNGPRFNGPWNQGPWNSDWNRNNGNYMNRGPWNKGGPGRWMNPGDPKGSMTRAWDDMLDTPHDMGKMPGGWRAPSISVPNPVDVGDELGENMRKVPGQMRSFVQ